MCLGRVTCKERGTGLFIHQNMSQGAPSRHCASRREGGCFINYTLAIGPQGGRYDRENTDVLAAGSRMRNHIDVIQWIFISNEAAHSSGKTLFLAVPNHIPEKCLVVSHCFPSESPVSTIVACHCHRHFRRKS